MSVLSIRNYKKFYNNHLVLEIPKLDLDHGIYWIKGDNGSGKSTLFKSICGIINFEGDCQLDQFHIKTDAVAYRNFVSYSEAEPAFPEFLTQKDLIKFIVKTRGTNQNQIENLISRFDTTDYYQQPVGTYSSGMLKKTGLMLAFLGHPKLIVLDEPFITLDQQTTILLTQFIQEIYESGVTFLISSHITQGSDQLPITNTFIIKNKRLETEK